MVVVVTVTDRQGEGGEEEREVKLADRQHGVLYCIDPQPGLGRKTPEPLDSGGRTSGKEGKEGRKGRGNIYVYVY